MLNDTLVHESRRQLWIAELCTHDEAPASFSCGLSRARRKAMTMMLATVWARHWPSAETFGERWVSNRLNIVELNRQSSFYLAAVLWSIRKSLTNWNQFTGMIKCVSNEWKNTQSTNICVHGHWFHLDTHIQIILFFMFIIGLFCW